MHQFKNEPETWKRLDYHIIQNGFVKQYKNRETLKTDIYWFESEGYEIKDFDCGNWNDKELMYDDFHAKFDFPVYFGRNYDALQESLNEEEIYKNGLVIVLKNFDQINAKSAHTLLDIFVYTARFHQTFGERILILIQVNENFKTEPFGSVSVNWQ
jgi:RNAse (barnase) inhibitor barstar